MDVAENLIKGFNSHMMKNVLVLRPNNHIRARWARTLLRFLADAWTGFRFFFERSVVLFPNYFCVPIPFSRSANVVVVHDLMFKHFPQNVNPAKRTVLDTSYRLAKRFADGVIFISEESQNDFIRIYGTPRNYTYIYNPVNVSMSPKSNDNVPIVDEPYAIANFHFYPHKNFERLIEVFTNIHKVCPDLRLYVTGHKAPFFDTIKEYSSAKNNIIHLGFLPKDQVLALIRGASFFMSLSKFEGFNMSAAEAGLLGKPLVLSDIPVHRELFSDCAHFIDLTEDVVDVNGIVDFVRGFESKTPSYADLVTPEEVAARYIAFMNEVAAA